MPFSRTKPEHAESPSRERGLTMRPVRNRLVRESARDNGLVRLHYLTAYRPWFARAAKRLGLWDGRPQERKLDLDELGGFCWNLVDGQRSVRDIAAVLAERFGLPGREAELAVAAFLRELGKRGIVGLAGD